MTIKTYREAVKEALAQEMERDERVVLIGEDLRGGHGGNAPEEAKIEAFGGVLGVTKGLWTQFGSDRVIDTHYRVGHHRYGGRRRSDGSAASRGIDVHGFFGVSHDALYNQAAKFRYMFGGKARARW
jgi:pyruvate dehydrogenase E1 component beta subunit